MRMKMREKVGTMKYETRGADDAKPEILRS